jgi:uncharacterized protein YggE
MTLLKFKPLLRLTVLFYFALFASTGFCQTKKNGDIIAEGGSKIKVRPDIAVISLSVEKTDSIEKNAIKNLNTEIDALVKVLYKLGFTDKTIKISDYDISSNNYRDEDVNKKYTATNTLKLEFEINTKLIGALYNEIQEAALSDLEISFDTKVSDSLEKKTRVLLVQLAIEDAKDNAKNIAKSLDIKLIRVKQVTKYKEGLFIPSIEINQIKFTPPKADYLSVKTYESSFDKFQVEDVELEEKITIVYEVSN